MSGKSNKGRNRRGAHNTTNFSESVVSSDAPPKDNLSASKPDKADANGVPTVEVSTNEKPEVKESETENVAGQQKQGEVQTQRRLPNMHVDKLLLGINTVNNQRYLNLQIENEKYKALVESVEVIDRDDEDDWQDVNEHLEDDDEEEDENLYALVDTINSKTLILCGVNAKSENFVNNFYEGLKLEKQNSIEELCHMLAPGV
ncbi:clustered mitochondria protein isoform X4 [Fagus crenata]